MATSTRSRRKTPAPPADAGAVAPAAAPAASPAVAPAARPARARRAAAPAAPAVAASPAAAPAVAAAKKPAREKPAARKPARAAPAAQAVQPAPAEPPAPAALAVASNTAAPAAPVAPATEPAPKQAAAKTPAVKQAPVKKAAAKQPVAKKAAATKASARKPAPSRRAPRPDPQAEATTQAVLAMLAAPAASADAPVQTAPADGPVQTAPVSEAAPAPALAAAPAATPAAAQEPAPAPAPTPAPTGPAHSQLVCTPGDLARITWLPGHACPAPLRQAAQRRCDAQGQLPRDDDAALPQLLRLAQEAGHALQVDDAVWALLAAHRDARHRLSALEAAYPDGPASPALQQLLRAPLPLFQAEGALFAVVAGRALIADERGLGKGVQAIAAAQLWRRHFGVQRVLVVCAPAQRSAWQRAWQRFAGLPAAGGPGSPASSPATQVVDGGHHQRQAQWAAAAGVRILSPEALQSGAGHLAHWSPDLVIVDEPQQLGLQAADWAALQAAPHALVLCGAPLADMPDLMDTLMAWLDSARLGPLAALRELHAASQGGQALGEADIERLTAALSRGMLQRLRADVADQLPPVVHSERLLPLAPGQRQVHDQHAAVLQRLLASWQASGWCSDSDQWRLAQALRAMQQACHRADPADAGSALAEATVQALTGALADLSGLTGLAGQAATGTGTPRVAVLCPAAGDVAQLAQRLGIAAGADAPVLLLGPGDLLPAGVEVVLQVGVPWRPRRQPGGPRGEAPAGQQWVYLVAQDSIECGLFDTLAGRLDAPRSPADGAARGYLQGELLAQWLQQVQAAWAATPTPQA